MGPLRARKICDEDISEPQTQKTVQAPVYHGLMDDFLTGH